MKLERVIIATDSHPMYADMSVAAARVWKEHIGCHPIILVVAKTLPSCLQHIDFAEVILFQPEEGLPTAFQAQCIRLLYPCLLTGDSAVITTDADMIPLSKRYFMNTILDKGDDTFIVYRNDRKTVLKREFPICYNAASPTVWKEVFGVSNEAELRTVFHKWYEGTPESLRWFTDQRQLFRLLKVWEKNGGKLVVMNDKDTGYKRINRRRGNPTVSIDSSTFFDDEYTDWHLPRTWMKKYRRVFSKLFSNVVNVANKLK